MHEKKDLSSQQSEHLYRVFKSIMRRQAWLTQLCMDPTMGTLPPCYAMGPPLGQAGEAPIMPSHALSNPASRQVTHADCVTQCTKASYLKVCRSNNKCSGAAPRQG